MNEHSHGRPLTRSRKRAFWSGGNGAAKVSAQASGYHTIEMTLIGRSLEFLQNRGVVIPRIVWIVVAAQFALCSRNAAVFIREPQRADSTYQTIEEPILRMMRAKQTFH